MIIQQKRSPRVLLLRIGAVGGIAMVALLFYFIASWMSLNHRKEGVRIVCDMESVAVRGDTAFFQADGASLQNGNTQTSEVARSGRHSCKLFHPQEFGATWKTRDLRPGDLLEASVWYKGKDHKGMLIGSGTWGFYQAGTLSGRQEGEWEELTLRVRVPAYVHSGEFSCYVWNPEPDPAYFDDLSIRHVRAGEAYPMGAVPAEDSIATLDLVVGDAGWGKLQRHRDAAMKAGLLGANEQDWVKLKMITGRQEISGKLRLKGDWTDHLLGNKWSFRIALDEGQAWRRMTTFSVQNPETRFFLSEWVFHQWLDREDILTPRYGFVRIKVNGISKGLYAYEEHFEKQILEYNQRREGPILKWDEEGLWQAQEIAIENGIPDFEARVPAFKAASTLPFGMKSATKDTAMMRQVVIAQKLVQQYKTGQKSVWDIFDARKVARYFAILDILGAQHGIIWHNQRWYYNPVIAHLEPIGFDGFTENGPLTWIDKPFIGFSRNVRYMAAGYRELMFERFFHDKKFLELYIAALFEFSDPAYLEALYRELEPRILHFEEAMQKEWPGYAFDRKAFFERAKTIRLLLQPLSKTSAKAFLQGKTEKGYHYRVYNFHCLPVFLEGVGAKPTKIDAPFTEEVRIDAYNNEFPAEFQDAWSKSQGKWVFFRVPGIDSLFSAEILPWEEPEGLTPEQSLFRDLQVASNEIYQVDESSKRVTFKTGKYRTGKDILFPPGYQIWFEKGVELDLTNKAKFISKSQVLMFGEQDHPILVTSSDHSANGFTVLQAEGKSEFHYVAFDNLNTLQYQGWNLTGAVTLYESECLFDHARFVNSHCEDALNTIRCVFTF
ncbi:MAG: hypothetical protein RLZZ165_1165, partial [Bacteroidota bacterium]